MEENDEILAFSSEEKLLFAKKCAKIYLTYYIVYLTTTL